MKIPTDMSRLKGVRHLREIMAQAVWAYHRFALSTGDVEDRLAQRGVNASREGFRHTAMRVPTRSNFDAITPPKLWSIWRCPAIHDCQAKTWHYQSRDFAMVPKSPAVQNLWQVPQCKVR